MIKVFILLLILFVIYVLPFTIAIAAAVRLGFGFYGSRQRMVLALILALPQCAFMLFGNPPGFLGSGQVPAMTYVTGMLTLIGVGFWWLGAVRGRGGHYWIEFLLIVVIPIFWIASIKNWIAH